MFNFFSDASSVSSTSGFDRNESVPNWTVAFDSDTWVLIVPSK